MHRIANRELWAFVTVLDKDKITEHYGVLRTQYIKGIVNTNGQNVGT